MVLNLTANLISSGITLAKCFTPPIISDACSTVASLVSPESAINFAYACVFSPITTIKKTATVFKAIAISLVMAKLIPIVKDEIKTILEKTEIPTLNMAELIVSEEITTVEKSLNTSFEEATKK